MEGNYDVLSKFEKPIQKEDMALSQLTPAQKEDMIASLGVLLLHDAEKEVSVRTISDPSQ